jgi:thiamine monophosphate synthase
VWAKASSRNLGPSLWIGTSAHSLESAYCAAYHDYKVDYLLFIGTCFVTESHPEKDPTQLEGPELPGQVCRALNHLSSLSGNKNQSSTTCIGDWRDRYESNCHIPIQFGANGVATIRAVLQAQSPLEVIQEIKSAMIGAS